MGTIYDFSGYVTKNDIKCSDGRTIRKDAFLHNDGSRVPLLWQHDHEDQYAVLGHMDLENREDGVYGYGKFNNTPEGQRAKQLVTNGDIRDMSIYAKNLQHYGHDVIHGDIREVSLVLSGANRGAYIQTLAIEHSEDPEDFDEAVIYSGEHLVLAHADVLDKVKEPEKELEHKESEETKDSEEKEEGEEKMADKEKTLEQIFNELTDEQKEAVYFIVGQAIEDAKNNDEVEHSEGGYDMKYNVFENTDMDNYGDTLTHADMEMIMQDAKRIGSLKESFLAHADETGVADLEYGIGNVDYLFPDAKTIDPRIQYIKRRTDWVADVMNAVKRNPVSRIKSIYADITPDEARAKGYIKGNLKKEEVFGLLKRTTSPTTVYKKQKLDRDDVLDITDIDVVAELKTEMRGMLDEELATCFLIGDGRGSESPDKVNEQAIRPIWKDSDLFTIKHAVAVASGDTVEKKADKLVDAAVIAMDEYEGAGNPTCFANQYWVTQMLLLKDANGRRIYKDLNELAAAMSVGKIVPVPVMKNKTRQDNDGKTRTLAGIIVNLSDYSVGADKGGSVSMFEDFDIDYNQMKYLIETRCSGSLTKPRSAIALEFVPEA